MTMDAKDQIVISCPIKGDNEYLIEFVEHYIKLGFDKIYFYDNNDDDEIQPSELLKKYFEMDMVEIIDYRNTVFNDILHRYDFYIYYDFKWVLFVDDDEFLELKRHNTVQEFLDSFNHSVKKIAINNLHFGDNEKCFYEPDKLVQETFPEPVPCDRRTSYGVLINSAIKSFLRKQNKKLGTFHLNAHSLLDENCYYNVNNAKIQLENFWRMKEEEISFDTAYIKHYCTKTLEEFIKCKIKRIVTNSSKLIVNRYDWETYYFLYNKKTTDKMLLIEYFTEKYISTKS